MSSPFPVSPPQISYPPPPSLADVRKLPHLPTHYCFSALAFPYSGVLSLHWTKGLSSHWCPTRPSSATYAARAMGSLHVYVLFGWWFSSWELWGVWLVDNVVLSMRLQTASALSVLSLVPPLGNLCSVQWLAESIHLCICQALAEPLRRQLYQASVCKLFLASTIVSVFGDCIWDVSPGGAVSGLPFLQSLPHTLFSYLLSYFETFQFYLF